MCGSAQKGGINADTVGSALSGNGACYFSLKRRSSRGRKRKEENQSAIFPVGGVYLSTLQPQQENAAFAE